MKTQMKRLLVAALVLPLLCGFTFRRRFHNGFPAEWNVGRYSDFSIKQVPQAEKSIEGKVAKIVDGGTIWVVDEHNRTRRVKLNGIIAPTGRQKYAKESQAKLASFINNQVVVVTFTDIDQRGRILGWVKHNGVNVNIAMLREGCARHDRLVKSPEFAAAEKVARRKQVGMWGPTKSAPSPEPYLPKVQPKASLPAEMGMPASPAASASARNRVSAVPQ